MTSPGSMDSGISLDLSSLYQPYIYPFLHILLSIVLNYSPFSMSLRILSTSALTKLRTLLWRANWFMPQSMISMLQL